MQISFSSRVFDIHIPTGPLHALTVTAADTFGGAVTEYTCRLLVGADGANSSVRTSFEAAQPGSGWDMVVSHSPSGGLHYKVCYNLHDPVAMFQAQAGALKCRPVVQVSDVLIYQVL